MPRTLKSSESSDVDALRDVDILLMRLQTNPDSIFCLRAIIAMRKPKPIGVERGDSGRAAPTSKRDEFA
ncbi:hypothetical protein RRSWK_06599 [Rhodopirellula sp. SWK7]|nr:hypothetical protein RRSWK_06599 [Rhodopirellula sp. SWK7]